VKYRKKSKKNKKRDAQSRQPPQQQIPAGFGLFLVPVPFVDYGSLMRRECRRDTLRSLRLTTDFFLGEKGEKEYRLVFMLFL
jgi:hypothetical protein